MAGIIILVVLTTLFFLFINGINKSEMHPEDFKFVHTSMVLEGSSINVYSIEGNLLVRIMPHCFASPDNKNITNEQMHEISYITMNFAHYYNELLNIKSSTDENK